MPFVSLDDGFSSDEPGTSSWVQIFRRAAAWRRFYAKRIAPKYTPDYVPPRIDFSTSQVVVASFTVTGHTLSCRVVDARKHGAMAWLVVDHRVTTGKAPLVIRTCWHAVQLPRAFGVPNLRVRRRLVDE